MHLRNKLTAIFAFSISSIFLIGSIINYFGTKTILEENSRFWLLAELQKVKASIEVSYESFATIEATLEDHLYASCIALKYALGGKKAKDITVDDLKRVRDLTGVSHITLFQKREVPNQSPDIIGVVSTDPKDIGQNAKEWGGYWYPALLDLFQMQEPRVKEGVSKKYFWAGPISFSSSSPDHMDKWGYYYDGSTDYLINPYIRDARIAKLTNKHAGPDAIIQRALQESKTVLDVAIINPKNFYAENDHNELEITKKSIVHGTYRYKSSEDNHYVQQAILQKTPVFVTAVVNNQKVFKSFTPITTPSGTMVLTMVTDYITVEKSLQQQIENDLLALLMVVALSLAAGYLLARSIVRPLEKINIKVQKISSGEFTQRIKNKRSDELGNLIESINEMSASLETMTSDLHQMNKNTHELFVQTVMALAKSVDARDPYTHHHSQNVALYSLDIAKEMGLSEEECFHIYLAGLLHDIGKIATPEHILNKEGKLTDEEFEIIKKHPEDGYEIVNKIDSLCERGINTMVLYHHERLNGCGYPHGIKGDAIPLGAKILAVADSYDAMTTNRSYRTALTHDFAMDQLYRGIDTHYERNIVESFQNVLDRKRANQAVEEL